MAQPNTLLHALLLWAFILISSAHASSDSELCSTAKTPDLAISYCTHAIKAGGLGNDGLAIVYSNRGDAWFNKGEYSKSIADYSRTIKLDQTSVLGWSRRCWVRAIYGQIPQALADCNKALSLSPDDSETLNSRGLVYLKMNDYAAAIVDYAAALVHDPESASSLFGRGLAELRKGDVAKGNADTAAAKVIQPNIAEEFKIYGLSEHKMGDRKTRQDNPKVAEKATWKTDEMAVVVLAHLERVKDYQELSALYAKRSTADVNWLRGDEGQAIDAQLKSWRKDAAAVSIIHGKIGRELQYSIGGMVVTDAGIAVADLEKSSAYRETIAEAIAQNIMTSPLDAKVMAALAAFRNEPAAHEAVSKGLQAAHEQNWQLAIDDFQTARKLTPDAPELLGYLGLAESKIPGRELRAIAWFGTYLAANPHAPNAEAVKGQIRTLQAQSRSNILHLIQMLQLVANQNSTANANMKSLAAAWIANAKSQLGDTAGAHASFLIAQSNADQIEGNTEGKDFMEKLIASDERDMVVTQANAGDIKGAQSSADLIVDTKWKGNAEYAIVWAQLKAGDISGAQSSTDLIVDTKWKCNAEYAIVSAQLKAGNIPGAQDTARQISAADWKNGAESDIARAQVHAGDIAGARQTAELLTTQDDKDFVELSIEMDQAVNKDIAGAQKTAELIHNTSLKQSAANNIARAQVIAGDIAGARRTAETIEIAWLKVDAETFIFEAQQRAGDTAGAQATLLGAQRSAATIADAKDRSHAEALIAGMQASAPVTPDRDQLKTPAATNGSQTDSAHPDSQPAVSVSDWNLEFVKLDRPMFLDPTAHLKTLPSGDPQKTFDELNEAVFEVVSAHAEVEALLSRQAKQQPKP